MFGTDDRDGRGQAIINKLTCNGRNNEAALYSIMDSKSHCCVIHIMTKEIVYQTGQRVRFKCRVEEMHMHEININSQKVPAQIQGTERINIVIGR